jgi:hypothetical protein
MAKKPAPQPAPPPFTIPGEFVRQTFIREYKAKGNSEAAAVAYFDNGLKLGNIIKLRYRGDVCIYEFKK